MKNKHSANNPIKFTRRDILTAFLGLPIALAACKLNSENDLIEGEIVGQNVDLGHVLRERRNFEVPESNWQTIDVAIVGAGIAGLTAAELLVDNGWEVTLYEARSRPGGRINTDRHGNPGGSWSSARSSFMG